MSEVGSCQFCGSVSSKRLFPISKLWSYLCQEKICGRRLESDDDPRAKFSFSLVVGGDGDFVGLVSLCGDCAKELGRLEGLVKELEGIKTRIYNQVARMKQKKRGDLEKTVLQSRATPRGTTVLEGSTEGKEEISRTLQFLDGYCQAMCSLPVTKTEMGVRVKSEESRAEEVIPETSQSPTPSSPEDPLVSTSENLDISASSFLEVEVTTPAIKLESVPSIDPNADDCQPTVEEGYQQWNDFEVGEMDTTPDSDPLAQSTVDLDFFNQQESAPVFPPPPPPVNIQRASKKTSTICPQCGKNLGTYRNAFKNHMRTHTGEKPYKCQFCDKRFGYRGDLTRHHKIMHTTGTEPFSCAICQKTFNLKFNLNAHIKNVHQFKNMKKGS